MILMGFDVATRAGIAIGDGERIVHVESFKAKATRPEGLGGQEIDVEYEAELGEQFRSHVTAMIASWGPEAIGMEEPRTRDFEREKIEVNHGAKWYGQAITKTTERASSNLALVRNLILCAHLVGICRRKNIPVYRCTAEEWRRAFLGYARAPKGTANSRNWLKEAVMQQCKLIGADVPNNDAGDAVGVLWWLRGHLNPRIAGHAGDLFNRVPA